jgi:hypothetical protein
MSGMTVDRPSDENRDRARLPMFSMVMFVPDEIFFAAATEREAHLFDDAIGSRVRRAPRRLITAHAGASSVTPAQWDE